MAYNWTMGKTISPPTAESILQQAECLNVLQRAELAARLLDSMEDGTPQAEIDTAWVREIERRLAEIDSGQARMIPWAQARSIIMGADDECSTA